MLSSNLPLSVKAALKAFTDEEVEMLEAFFDDENKELIGIGFVGPGGRLTKFGEPEKIKAIRVLEAHWQAEYEADMQRATLSAIEAIKQRFRPHTIRNLR